MNATAELEAVLFDMDGVVTDTAEAHAAAWKRLFDEYRERRAEDGNETFPPFDSEADYHKYVDGKARYDGVQSFLESRGIKIPHGSETDSPDTETICGLGNRKNHFFHEWLERNTVRTFPGTLHLIHALRRAGVKTAIFSASRNAEMVLRNAGVLDLFDTKVDGTDLAEGGLPGKPDPAMLKEAARRLGVAPDRGAIIEDAIAGVQAGVRGGFAVVIGVDRTGNGEALREAGATLVVHDLAEVRFTADRKLTEKSASDVPIVPMSASPPEGPAPDRGEGVDGRGDEWRLVYHGYDPKREGLRESLCALGNGYFVTRGAAPDCVADGVHYPGTYLAGGYNRLRSTINGHEVENEDLVNLPNWLPLTFRIDDGPWFGLDDVDILSYHQELDLKAGVLRRNLRIRDAQGRTTRWSERRLVSVAEPHLAALSIELAAEDWTGQITVRTALDGGVVNAGVPRYRGFASRHFEALTRDHGQQDLLELKVRTNQSHIEIAQVARTRLYRGDTELDVRRSGATSADEVRQELSCPLSQGEPVTVEKIVSIYTSQDLGISEPLYAARRAIVNAGRFDALLADHVRTWSHLWEDCDIDLHDDGQSTELKLRVYIFHLLQTVSVHTVDRDAGVPARGWHGEAYRGHIFWDELYIFPFLTLRMPILTRGLLLYRYRRLPEARHAARIAGFKGAMYPWQSGSDGREETPAAYLNPLSGRWIPDHTYRQRHIGSAIAFNIWQYHQVTEDHEFLYSYGAEMMLEIARFWASVAQYAPDIDRYEIKGVMGPDEFHTGYPGADLDRSGGVDNNAYTNVMAAWVLSRACDVLDLLPEMQRRKLHDRIGLQPQEIELWREIGRKLRVPIQDDGIISQFDGFDSLAEFDWKGHKRRYGNIQRLDQILEAENDTPNRYKLSKQADVLMLFYLFSADELRLLFEQLGYSFDQDAIPRNIRYYLERTSHGSTLSGIAHSWVLARSNRSGSWRLFQHALDSDIADTQGGTTREGIHVGAMAGTVDLVQRCYLGIEMRGNVLHFDPALPAELRRVRVRLRYRKQILDVESDHDVLTISSRPFTANPITIGYRGRFRDVSPGDSYAFHLLKPEERHRDENRDRRKKS